MTQPAVPDSADWQRRWTIDAGSVMLQPVTRRIAQAVLGGGSITGRFESGSLHDRIPQAMGVAIRDIDSGAAAVLACTSWLIVRCADGRVVGDLGTQGRPAVRAALRSATAWPRPRGARGWAPSPWPPSSSAWRRARNPAWLTAVTVVANTASRRLLERQGFHLTGPVPGTDEVRYTLSLQPAGQVTGRTSSSAPFSHDWPTADGRGRCRLHLPAGRAVAPSLRTEFRYGEPWPHPWHHVTNGAGPGFPR